MVWLIRLLAMLSAAAVLGAAGAAAQEPDRVIVVLAVEFDMTRGVDQTPFPDTLEHHPDLHDGGGLLLEPPGEDGEWRARAYSFHPATIVVRQGETVLLRFFGINGNEHPITIPGLDHSFTVRRGEVTEVRFTADTEGLFEIICHSHQPSMTAQLLVTP